MPHINSSAYGVGEIGIGGQVVPACFPNFCTPVVNAEAGVITPANFTAGILGGLLLRDPAGASRADIPGTGTEIATAMGNPQVGQCNLFAIRNTADAAETITVTASTGVTLSGTMTIAQNNTKLFLMVCTGTNTFTIYSLGTFVH